MVACVHWHAIFVRWWHSREGLTRDVVLSYERKNGPFHEISMCRELRTALLSWLKSSKSSYMKLKSTSKICTRSKRWKSSYKVYMKSSFSLDNDGLTKHKAHDMLELVRARTSMLGMIAIWQKLNEAQRNLYEGRRRGNGKEKKQEDMARQSIEKKKWIGALSADNNFSFWE
jgi:hypothetical protein